MKLTVTGHDREFVRSKDNDREYTPEETAESEAIRDGVMDNVGILIAAKVYGDPKSDPIATSVAYVPEKADPTEVIVAVKCLMDHIRRMIAEPNSPFRAVAKSYARESLGEVMDLLDRLKTMFSQPHEESLKDVSIHRAKPDTDNPQVN